MTLALPLPWVSAAACRNMPPSTMFPHEGESLAAALAVCRGCPVRAACLEYALAYPEHYGVWGGTSERERRRMRRRRQYAERQRRAS